MFTSFNDPVTPTSNDMICGFAMRDGKQLVCGTPVGTLEGVMSIDPLLYGPPGGPPAAEAAPPPGLLPAIAKEIVNGV